jgi:hypothetical protein
VTRQSESSRRRIRGLAAPLSRAGSDNSWCGSLTGTPPSGTSEICCPFCSITAVNAFTLPSGVSTVKVSVPFWPTNPFGALMAICGPGSRPREIPHDPARNQRNDDQEQQQPPNKTHA